jgi:hypothetical protein
VKRAVGAAVMIGMICLGCILGEWMVRVRPVAPDSLAVQPPESLSVFPTHKIAKLPRTPRAPSEVPPAFVLNPRAFLSRAPADSLDLLPGIGPVLAGRIVEARRARGSFSSWNDVLAVKGIGPRLVARWKSLCAGQ